MKLLQILARPFVTTWNELALAPREMSLIFLISMLTSFGQTGASLIMVSYFSDEFGMTDSEASQLFAFSSVTYILLMLVVGRVIDRIGIRASLLTGGVLGVIGSIMISLASVKAVLGVAVVGILPLTVAFISPVITIATLRYTFEGNSRTVFMTMYMISNAGSALSYLYVDFIRVRFTDPRRLVVLHREYSATAARVIFMTGAISTLLAALVATGIKNVAVTSDGRVQQHIPLAASRRLGWLETLAQPNFRRMVLFSAVMLPLMKMFTHFDVTFPKAAVRELGPTTLFGTVKALNPIAITVLQMPVSYLFSRFSIYTSIVVGTGISALSVFIFCLPASYGSWISAFCVFTLGEMIFSHRVNEFSSKFMPRNSEGVYSTLVGIPLILPRFFVDSLSGWLLSTYCPATGERHCNMMWLIIALMACITPVLLIPTRTYFMDGIREARDDLKADGDVKLECLEKVDEVDN